MPTSSPKRRLTGPQYAARFDKERALQQRRYCNAFELWRSCRRKECRRHCGCRGELMTCLVRAIDTVPHHVQWQTRQDILEATPRNVGGPERAARQSMPYDFYRETTADVVAAYLRRLARLKAAAKPSADGRSG